MIALSINAEEYALGAVDGDGNSRPCACGNNDCVGGLLPTGLSVKLLNPWGNECPCPLGLTEWAPSCRVRPCCDSCKFLFKL